MGPQGGPPSRHSRLRVWEMVCALTASHANVRQNGPLPYLLRTFETSGSPSLSGCGPHPPMVALQRRAHMQACHACNSHFSCVYLNRGVRLPCCLLLGLTSSEEEA